MVGKGVLTKSLMRGKLGKNTNERVYMEQVNELQIEEHLNDIEVNINRNISHFKEYCNEFNNIKMNIDGYEQ